MSEIIIRPAVPEDGLGIAQVQAYTWKTTYAGLMPDAVLDKRIAEIPQRAEKNRERILDGETFFVLESEKKVVGMAVCKPSRNPDYPEDGEIQAIYILKEYQGRGLGRKLFSHCEEYLRKCGHSNMIVNCLDGNPTAHFYGKMGGAEVGKRCDLLGEGVMLHETIFRFAL